MKFTSEDLMKAMGLNVGDRVKVDCFIYKVVIKDENINERNIALENEDGTFFLYIKRFVDQEFEILPRPKRIGDLKCEECSCATCPLRVINCVNITTSVEKTLYQILGEFLPKYQDQEIHDLLKARLDKEVEE